MNFRTLALTVAVALVASVLIAPSVIAGEPGAPHRVNEDLEPGPGVVSAAITPDGETIVYLATQDELGVVELFTAPVEGGPTDKISHELPTGGGILDFLITADGERVIYRGQGTEVGAIDLWSVPIGGGTAVRISGAVPSGGVATEYYEEAPGQDRIVWFGDTDTDDEFEVFSAPSDGSGSVARLNNPLATNDDVAAPVADPPAGTDPKVFEIAPDGSVVVFRVFDASATQIQLWSAAIDGAGSAQVVNGSLTAGGNVDGDFAITGDSARVVYLADEDTDDKFELYAAPAGGGGPSTKLSGALEADTEVLEGVEVAPSGSHAVYRTFDEGDGVFELFSARTDGSGGPIGLNGTLVAGGSVDGTFEITPDSTRVVYVADERVNDKFELFSVPIGGGSVATVSGSSPDAADVLDEDLGADLLITPDSSRALFVSDRGTSGAFDLWSAPVGGGTPARLTDELSIGGVLDFAPTPDSSRVIYIATENKDVQFEIFSAPVGGGPSEQLNGAIVDEGDVVDFDISPQSAHVIYRADELVNDTTELFSVTLGISCNGRLATHVGTEGDDEINGTAGPDVIVGLGGDDVINGLGAPTPPISKAVSTEAQMSRILSGPGLALQLPKP